MQHSSSVSRLAFGPLRRRCHRAKRGRGGLETAHQERRQGWPETDAPSTPNSYVVGKIANMDYPEQWPTLLPTVLGVIPGGTDVQLHGALKVLGDVVDESLSEEQFFGMARDIVKVLYDVAVNEARKPSLRALAVSVFRSCFDMMDMVKEDHMREVRGFAEEALKAWLPFFLQTLKTRLDGDARADGKQPESWNGIVALKFQVVKTLGKIKEVFKQLLLPESLNFFGAVWEELSVLQGAYQQQYVANFDQGRLEDSDGLPYTLDFLVLEELDFFNVCLKASTVQKELEAQLKAHGGQLAQTPWAMDLMKLLVAYAQITREEEDLWDIDVTLYIAEETSVTANYTPRAACGDLLVKLGEWIHHGALDALFAYTKSLFAGGGDAVPWRTKESALYLFTVLVRDFQDVGRPVADEVCAAYLELVSYAIERRDEPLLRARGYLVAGLLVQNTPAAAAFLDRTIAAITDEESELVQVACVKAVDGFIKSEAMPADRQLPIIMAISKFLADKDMTEMEDADDLLITLVDTLRLAISIDKRVALADNVQALDLLFLVAKHGAANYQISLMVCEAFEEIVQALSDPVSYAALCAKVLPSLTGTFDVGKITENDPLITVSFPVLSVLFEANNVAFRWPPSSSRSSSSTAPSHSHQASSPPRCPSSTGC